MVLMLRKVSHRLSAFPSELSIEEAKKNTLDAKFDFWMPIEEKVEQRIFTIGKISKIFIALWL